MTEALESKPSGKKSKKFNEKARAFQILFQPQDRPSEPVPTDDHSTVQSSEESVVFDGADQQYYVHSDGKSTGVTVTADVDEADWELDLGGEAERYLGRYAPRS
jgi:hypothetical protein